MMTAHEDAAKQFVQGFLPLFDDFNDREVLLGSRPLLAHYTSVGSLEKILLSETVLMSNPLFMNDMQELWFGLRQGHFLINELKQEIYRALGSSTDRFNQF